MSNKKIVSESKQYHIARHHHLITAVCFILRYQYQGLLERQRSAFLLDIDILI